MKDEPESEQQRAGRSPKDPAQQTARCPQCGADVPVGRITQARGPEVIWRGFCPQCGAAVSGKTLDQLHVVEEPPLLPWDFDKPPGDDGTAWLGKDD